MDKNDILNMLRSGIDENAIIDEVVEKTGINRDAARKRVKRQIANMLNGTPATNVAAPTAPTATIIPAEAAAAAQQNGYNYSTGTSGELVFTNVEPILNAKGMVSDDQILECLHLKDPGKPSAYVVERIIYNTWDGMKKGGIKTPMGQCKIIVRKKVDSTGFTMADADALLAAHAIRPRDPMMLKYVKVVVIKDAKTEARIPGAKVEVYDNNKNKVNTYTTNERGEIYVEYEGGLDGWYAKTVYAPKPFRKPAPIDIGAIGYSLLILLPDMHLGMMAHAAEAGRNYDLHIARTITMACCSQIISRLQQMNLPLRKIYLATLGDLLHVDNDAQTTTKGTFQQVEGRMHKIYDTAITLMEDILCMFANVAPVEYIYVPGNHDRVLGYTVARALERSFKNEPAITVAVSPSPTQVLRIGKTAIIMHHGDMNKKNLENLHMTKIMDHTGIRSYYVCVGHLHSSSQGFTANGKVTVEHFDSITYASAWEDQQGYPESPFVTITALVFDGSGAPPMRIVGSYDPEA